MIAGPSTLQLPIAFSSTLLLWILLNLSPWNKITMSFNIRSSITFTSLDLPSINRAFLSIYVYVPSELRHKLFLVNFSIYMVTIKYPIRISLEVCTVQSPIPWIFHIARSVSSVNLIQSFLVKLQFHNLHQVVKWIFMCKWIFKDGPLNLHLMVEINFDKNINISEMISLVEGGSDLIWWHVLIDFWKSFLIGSNNLKKDLIINWRIWSNPL